MLFHYLHHQSLLYHLERHLKIEFLNYLFVTDTEGVLLGEVSLAILVVCDPSSLLVSQVMRKNYIM